MIKKQVLFLLVVMVVTCHVTHAQTTPFKTYTNAKDRFSFDVPAYWTVKYSKEEYGFLGVPVTNAEKLKYKDCFEGIVFRMTVYSTGLDSALVTDGYTKNGDSYFITDKLNAKVKAQKVTGNGWTGIYHLNACGIMCKAGPGTGKCQFFYFSNGKTTVSIATNGKELSPGISKRLQTSFHFQ